MTLTFSSENCWYIYKGVKSHIKTTTLFMTMIPSGPYCYGEGRWDHCVFWKLIDLAPSQMNGYCRYLNRADWIPEHSKGGSTGLLWDQCKECNINEYF